MTRREWIITAALVTPPLLALTIWWDTALGWWLLSLAGLAGTGVVGWRLWVDSTPTAEPEPFDADEYAERMLHADMSIGDDDDVWPSKGWVGPIPLPPVPPPYHVRVTCGCGALAETRSEQVIAAQFVRSFNETHQHSEPIPPGLCMAWSSDFGGPAIHCILLAGHTGAHEGRVYSERLSAGEPFHWTDLPPVDPEPQCEAVEPGTGLVCNQPPERHRKGVHLHTFTHPQPGNVGAHEWRDPCDCGEPNCPDLGRTQP